MKYTYYKIWKKEISNNLLNIFYTYIYLMLISTINLNEIIILILSPIIELNNEIFLENSIYNSLSNLLVNQINNSLDPIYHKNYLFDYIPTIEVNLPIKNTTNLYLIISNLNTIIIIIPYIIIIFFSKKIKKILLIYILNIILISKLLIPIYYKMSLLNYQENNYIEFDIAIDLKQISFFFYLLNIFSYIILLIFNHLINKKRRKKIKYRFIIYFLIIILIIKTNEFIFIIIYLLPLILIIEKVIFFNIINKNWYKYLNKKN